MQIPAIVYDKYNEAMTMFLLTSNFGTECQLVYKKTETLTPSLTNPVRQRLTVNGQGGQVGSLRGTESTRVVETTRDATLRVYTDKKAFDKIGMFEFVAGSCMTIGPLSLMDDIHKAHSMIVDTNRYERSSEVKPWGLNGEYCVAFWSKT